MEPSQQEDCRLVQKLMRYFIFRSIQVILQSRSSKAFRCSCKVYSPQVSLGLSLEDDPSIAVSIKSQFSSGFELRNNDAHSVEIYLCSERSQDQRLFLEIWTFRFTDEETDPAIKRMKTFDRLVVALKALWSTSRVLPAYRIARRQQTGDRCLLCFNIRRAAAVKTSAAASESADEAARLDLTSALGEDYRERRVAAVRTAAGQLALTCCYRNLPACGQPEQQLLAQLEEAAAAAAAAAATGYNRASGYCLDRKYTNNSSAPGGHFNSHHGGTEVCDSSCDGTGPDETDSDDEEEDAEDDDEDLLPSFQQSGREASVPEGLDEQQQQQQQQQEVLQCSLTDSQLVACFADAGSDDCDGGDDQIDKEQREAQRQTLVRRLKSVSSRLAMFQNSSAATAVAAGAGSRAAIGAIPQQLDYFERDLAEFDLLLNDILAREDADCCYAGGDGCGDGCGDGSGGVVGVD